jgi:membrane associated rhomboid family serine protease
VNVPDPPPDRPDETPPERTSGLTLEPCYRHPGVLTGVHCARCGKPICPDDMREAAVGFQCPDCVAEAARSMPRGRSRLVVGGRGPATTALIAINVVVFAIEVLTGASGLLGGGSSDTLVRLGALYPARIAVLHEYWRFLTATFLHAGLIHIGFNMYALYLFGYTLEAALGTARFLAIYFVSGFIASVFTFMFSDPNTLGVGASGAIFGLLGAFIAYNLRRRETAMGRANLRLAVILIGLNLFIGLTVPNIDIYAHLGGLVAGFACGFLAEGFGPRQTRVLVMVAGFAALIGLGVVLTVVRTNAITALFGVG